MKKNPSLEFNVLYLGKASNFSKEIHRHLYTYRENIHFNYKVDSTSVDINKINQFNPHYIIADFSENENQYEAIFNQLKQINYPNTIYIFGVAGSLSYSVKQAMLRSACNFIYEHSASLDEPFFLVKSIILTIDPKLAEKKELAAAKTDTPAVLHLPGFISETSSTNFFIETNFDFKNKPIQKVNSELIQNKLVFSNENLKILGTDSNFVHPFFKYRTKVKHEYLKISEIEIIQKDINDNPKISSEDKIKTTNDLLIATHNDKKNNYLNWIKRNRINYDRDKDKRNIIIISKDTQVIKLKGRLLQNFVINQFKSIPLSHMKIIEKIKPSFIFYDLEVPPKIEKFIENPETQYELYIDDAISYNFIKNLSELFYYLITLNSKVKVVVFNRTTIPDHELKSIVGLDLITTLNCCASEQVINDYLEEFLIVEDSKVKQVKDKNADKSLYQEKEKFKTQINDNPIIFRFSDLISKVWIEVEGRIEIMTENQLLIKTKYDLPHNELIKVDSFISFFITPMKDINQSNMTNGEYNYLCVINGISSKERDFLRGYVITYTNDQKVS